MPPTTGSEVGSNENDSNEGQNEEQSHLNPMSIAENQHGNALLDKLCKQRETGRFCDVLLVVNGRHFAAHRNILSACSPYLDAILRSNKVVKEIVSLQGTDPHSVELLLNYIYRGSVVLDRKNVVDLLKLANNLLVTKLKNYCAEYLDRYLNADNCLAVKELAERFNLQTLVKNASIFLENNTDDCLLNSEQALDLPLYRVEAVLNDRSLQIRPEAAITFIVNWIGRCPNSRLEHMKGVMRDSWHVNLVLCPIEHIYTLLQGNHFLVNDLDGRKAFLEPAQGSVASYLAIRVMHGDTSGARPVSTESGDPQPRTDESAPKIVKQETSQPSQDPGCVTMEITEIPVGNGSNVQGGGGENGAVVSEGGQESQRDGEGGSGCGPNTGPVTARVPLKLTLKLSAPFNRKTRILGGERQTGAKPYRRRVNADSAHHANPVASSARTMAQAKLRAAKRSRYALGSPSRLAELKHRAQLSGSQPSAEGSVLSAGGIFTFDDPATLNIPPDHETSPSGNDAFVDDSEDDDCGSNHSESDQRPVLVLSHNVDGAGDKNACAVDSAAQQHVNAVVYKCPKCIYTSANRQRIESHAEKAHKDNRIYVCTVCQHECNWNRQFYTHMRGHFPGPPFQCDGCEYSAERIQLLLTHRMKHSEERPYKCGQCDYRSRTKTNLMSHQKSHSAIGDGERPYTCPQCDRTFAIRSTLEQHLATHSDTRPYQCHQCSFSTKYQSHLISHRRIHTGDVFRCTYADCSYSSPKKSQLAAHLRTHLAVRAHQCGQCHRSFIEKSHLVRHERIHLAEKPFKCDLCDYASSRRDKLKEHVAKHHGSQSTLRQKQRKYRRQRQLASLVAQAGNTFRPITPVRAQVKMQQQGVGSLPVIGAVPIVGEASQAVAGELAQPGMDVAGGQHIGQASNQAQISQQFVRGGEHRPSSASLPHLQGGPVAQQPSPAYSLNFNLGFDTPVVGKKDVMLASTSVAVAGDPGSTLQPTSTLPGAVPRHLQHDVDSMLATSLTTPTPGQGAGLGLHRGVGGVPAASPMGGNLLQSAPTTPVGEGADANQRPISLPSLQQQQQNVGHM